MRLLHVAARIVADEGLTAVSMRRVATEAGVSKALVYNYFPSCQQLLYELLRRESVAVHEKQVAVAQGVTDFVELTRVVTRVYLRHVAEHGELLRPLMAEPALTAQLQRETRVGRPRAVRLFARLMSEQYGIPPQHAHAAADLLIGLSGAAGRRMQETGETPEYLEDLCVQLVMTGVQGLSARAPDHAPGRAKTGDELERSSPAGSSRRRSVAPALPAGRTRRRSPARA